MNTLFDVLRHLVEQAGGWASDEVKAEAHKIISEHEQQAQAVLGELDPTATAGPSPAGPSSPAAGDGPMTEAPA